MKLGILGPLTFDVDGSCRIPSAPKPRTALALLLLNANTIVPASALIDELWRDRPPVSARTTLQTYVLQLRKLLPAGADPDRVRGQASILRTSMTGYRLDVPSDALDATWFDRWITDGRRALEHGDNRSGVDLLHRALAMWRGDPFADVLPGPTLEGARLRLVGSRLGVVDQCIDAELGLGRHRELLGDLAGLVSQHPLQENLHAQFMLALARSGHRVHALKIFHRLRHTFVEDLGMEPSSKLQQLHQSILTCDPTVMELPVSA